MIRELGNSNNTNGTKNTHKKPPELSGDVELRRLKHEIRVIHCAISYGNSQGNMQVAKLRGYISTDIPDELHVVTGGQNSTEILVQDVLKSIREWLISMPSVTLDNRFRKEKADGRRIQ